MKCFVEARVLGSSDVWKPIPVIFGVGRYEVDDAKQAEAEVRLWSRTAHGRRYEFRVRREAPPPAPKTEEKRVAEVARQEAVSKSFAKSVTAAKKQLAAPK
jgi:hypothetical protein